MKREEIMETIKSLATCADCSDTYGLYDDHLYISMLGQKDIDFYNNSIDYTDLDELYKRAEMEINDKLKQGKN